MTTEGYGSLGQDAIDSAQHVNVGDCSGGSGGGCGSGGNPTPIIHAPGNHWAGIHWPRPSWVPHGWVYRGNGWWCSQCQVRWTSTSCWGWSQPHRRMIRPCEGVGRCTGNCASCTPWNRCTDRVRYRSGHH